MNGHCRPNRELSGEKLSIDMLPGKDLFKIKNYPKNVMMKAVLTWLLLFLLVSVPGWAQSSPFWTGDGGRGMSLAILLPEGRGFNAEEEYLRELVQGVLVTNIKKFSAIDVRDRVSLDRVIKETLDYT